MKYILIIVLLGGLASCSNTNGNTKTLLQKIDSLEAQVANAYTPGFGEFMSNIQAHHSKLWFAGKNRNWKLADFEVHEIMESVEDIKKYQQDRPESKEIGMIEPVLDSMSYAIQKQDTLLFEKSYSLLTNTCNMCHSIVNFEFNVVNIPDTQPFSNQTFKLVK